MCQQAQPAAGGHAGLKDRDSKTAAPPNLWQPPPAPRRRRRRACRGLDCSSDCTWPCCLSTVQPFTLYVVTAPRNHPGINSKPAVRRGECGAASAAQGQCSSEQPTERPTVGSRPCNRLSHLLAGDAHPERVPQQQPGSTQVEVVESAGVGAGGDSQVAAHLRRRGVGKTGRGFVGIEWGC